MDRGNLDIQEAAALLQGEACVQVLASGASSAWTLRHLKAVVGVEPPAWPGQDWIYDDIALVRGMLPLDRLKEALLSGHERKLSISGLEVALPPVSPQVQWRHRPSYEQHDRDQFGQPSLDLSFSVGQQNPYQISSNGYMVGRGDCPSFPDVQYAFRAFFDGDYQLNGGMSLPSELMVVRIVDTRGRIGPIHVTATHMEVQVDGAALGGTSLEYYSPQMREARTVKEPGRVTFHLPDGLPDSSVWVWLKQDGRWLDHRALYRPWTAPEQLAAAGVTIDVPIDPLSTVEALVAGGEGPQVEFKRSLPETKSTDRNPYKTIAAFATGDGGWILFGVDRDELTVVGLDVDDIQEERDRLASLIRSRVNPTPSFEATPHVIDGKQILVLRIDTGASPPYGIVVDPNTKDRPEYFVRRGASTYPALPSDLRESVLSRQPQAPYPPGSGFLLGGAFPR